MSRRIAFRALPALIALPALMSAALLSVASPTVAQAAVKAHTASAAITVSAIEYKFKLSASSLSKPGTVTFKIKNNGHVAHDLQINKKTSKLLQPGQSTTLSVKFTKKGSYYYSCTVPGHAALGMKGYFSVK
jgi:uncharacterized cupredoxin-like copper-binding protein